MQVGQPGSTSSDPSPDTAGAPPEGVDADTVVDMSNTGSREEDVGSYLEPAIEVLAAGASTSVNHYVDIDGKEVCAV